MVTEKGTLKTEVLFDSTKKERYLLRKIWDEKKPVVSLIMSNAGMADAVSWDMTTLYVIKNLYKLGYGGVDILNMTSVISSKINTKEDVVLSDANVEQILKSAEKSEKVVICWGKIGENNKKIRLVQLKLLEKLKPYEDKLCHMASESGGSGFHPLAPQIRFTWVLEKFVLPEYLRGNTESDKKQDKQLQKDEQTA